MKKLVEIRYTVLGNFDKLDATPELIQILNSITSEFGLMPNTLSMQVVTNNGVKTRYRPQFMNIEKKYDLVVLPERIDITFKMKSYKETLELLDTSLIATKLFSRLGEHINEPCHRFAVFARGLVEGNSDSKIINNEKYFSDNQFVEWAIRNVIREKCSIKDRSENINFVIENRYDEHGINISIDNQLHSVKGTLYSIDANTLPYEKMKPFSISEYSDFYSSISESVVNKLDTLAGVYNG